MGMYMNSLLFLNCLQSEYLALLDLHSLISISLRFNNRLGPVCKAVLEGAWSKAKVREPVRALIKVVESFVSGCPGRGNRHPGNTAFDY